ncbi:acyl-CoA dehydrogenase family protein [Streptomyces shenzhenensis]|uniref:acyl-CoA dehydrogenase family protein n=1 Tax=Streptomyces shenzhenensis TaxID=943815 RepID=UPI0038004C4E
MSTPPVPVLASVSQAVRAAHDVAAELAADASMRDREGRFPYRAARLLAESGLLGIRIPAAYGGAGVDQRTVAEVFRVLAAADGALAQIPQSHFAFLDALLVAGDETLRREVFAAVLAGARIGNAASERGGKTAADFRTRVTQSADGLRLQGTKHYATGALGAQWIAVYALLDDELTVVFVPGDAPGVRLADDWAGMGQRATGSGTAQFDDVPVAAHRVIRPWKEPAARRGWWLAGRLAHTAIDVGIAENALHDGLVYLTARARVSPGLPFDTPGDDPLIQHGVGVAATRTRAARLLLEDAAHAVDLAWNSDDDTDVREARLVLDQAKAFAADVAVEVSSDLFSWTGTSATDDRHNLHRHWRNARTHTLHDPNGWKYASAGAALVRQAQEDRAAGD